MNSVLCVVVVLLAGVLVTDGKRFKRDLQERNLVEAAHAVSDVQSLQCVLETAATCEKELYIRDLKDELSAMSKLIKKLRTIDWFGGGHNDMWNIVEYDEWEILGVWGELQALLPQTTDETTGQYQAFGHLVEDCFSKLHAEDFSTQPDCNSVKARAMDIITECEASGFQKAMETLNLANLDLNNAENLKGAMTELLEILAEVRDINYYALGVAFLDCSQYTSDTYGKAITQDAASPQHIQKAVEQLAQLFSGNDDDKRNLSLKKSLITQVKSINFARGLNVKATKEKSATDMAEIRNLIRSILKKY